MLVCRCHPTTGWRGAPSPANERCVLANPQSTLEELAFLVDRLEQLHHELHRLELAVEVQLRRN